MRVKKLANNYAFIDSQNLNLGVRSLGWILDFKKFRVHLKEKYAVTRAYIFIGYVEGNESLYDFLRQADYVCIFKPVTFIPNVKNKGNCDAELVLQTMIDYSLFDKALIVSGDGDFYCLVKYLIQKDKLEALIVPNKTRLSALFDNAVFHPYLRFMEELQERLAFKKRKAP